MNAMKPTVSIDEFMDQVDDFMDQASDPSSKQIDDQKNVESKFYVDYKVSPQEAEKVLKEVYGIEGSAHELFGESDYNFKIKIDGEDSYVLKISRPNFFKYQIDFQTDLLNHLA